MAIIKRLVKGSALTHAEMDGNFTELENKASTVAEGFNTALTFNKNKYGSTNQSGNISFTLAASGHIDGIVIRYKITSNGVNTITFPSGFNVFNKPSDNIYPAGLHIFYFNYVGGDVDVVIPTYVAESNPTEPTEDTQDPTVPTGLTSPSKTETSVNLAWNAATDNVGVTGYVVYKNNVFEKEVSGLTAVVTGLTQGTQYSFTVSALDAAGNESAQSAPLIVSTEAASVATPVSPDTIGTMAIYYDTYDSGQMTLTGTTVDSFINSIAGDVVTVFKAGTPTLSSNAITTSSANFLQTNIGANSAILSVANDNEGWLIFKNVGTDTGAFISNALSSNDRFAIGMKNGHVAVGFYNGTTWSAKSKALADTSNFHKLHYKYQGGVLTAELDGLAMTGVETPPSSSNTRFSIGAVGSAGKAGVIKPFWANNGILNATDRANLDAFADTLI